MVEMGGIKHYLHLLVGHVRGRMGYECLAGEHRFRDVIDEFDGCLPRQFGCRAVLQNMSVPTVKPKARVLISRWHTLN